MKKTLSWALGAIAVLSSVMPIAAPAASAQTASSSSCHTFTANLGEGRYLSSADTQGLQMAPHRRRCLDLGHRHHDL